MKKVLRGAEFVCGHRHFNIFRTYNSTPGKFLADKSPNAQGFMTSTGRFVDREEAAKIARECGQVRQNLVGDLFSEDIY